MAKKLNKTRLRDTNVLLVLTLITILIVSQTSRDGSEVIHEPMELVGFILAAIAALGRMYSTAFLGGFKNRKVIDQGPFSVCRNPLYLFSLIGVTGIALMTVNVIVIAILPLAIYLIYSSLIKREEVYLTDKFGEAYLNYKAKTPRLIPNFKLYQAPAIIEMAPRTILNAFRDSAMWLVAYPLIETIEYLQDIHILKPIYYIYLF